MKNITLKRNKNIKQERGVTQMMTLNKKEHIINNDVKWEKINKTNLLTTVAVIIIFLTTIQLMVI